MHTAATPGWLRRSRARGASADMARAVTALPTPVVVWTPDHRVVAGNPAAEALGLRPGRRLHDGMVPARLPAAGDKVLHEEPVSSPDSSSPRHWAWVTVPMIDSRGRPCYVSVGGDVTDLRQAESRLRTLATTDPLTGLPNRPALLEELTGRLRADGDGVTVLFCDLDGFKAVNDTYGHSAGDLVLRTIAGRLRRAVRDGDQVGRLGGDEFVVVCSRLPSDVALALARRLAASAAQPIFVPGGAVTVGLSVGIATGSSGDPPATVLNAADSSMYHVKSWRGTQRAVTAAAG